MRTVEKRGRRAGWWSSLSAPHGAVAEDVRRPRARLGGRARQSVRRARARVGVRALLRVLHSAGNDQGVTVDASELCAEGRSFRESRERSSGTSRREVGLGRLIAAAVRAYRLAVSTF